jgi:tetratricopeptide (TPR) repeat protein
MPLFVLLALLQGPAPADASVARARQLSDEATAHYNAGRFTEAVPLFRAAYDLSGRAELLFNLAQSYRRGGDCHQAIDGFRRFLDSAPESALRPRARVLLGQLEPTCPERPVPTPAPLPATATPPAAPVPTPAGDVRLSPATGSPAGTSPRLLLFTGAAATLAAIGAGTVFVVDGRRHARWRDEDRILSGTDPGVSHADRVQRQEANDGRLRSIRRWDRVALGLAVAAGLASVATAVLWGSDAAADPDRATAGAGPGALPVALTW